MSRIWTRIETKPPALVWFWSGFRPLHHVYIPGCWGIRTNGMIAFISDMFLIRSRNGLSCKWDQLFYISIQNYVNLSYHIVSDLILWTMFPSIQSRCCGVGSYRDYTGLPSHQKSKVGALQMMTFWHGSNFSHYWPFVRGNHQWPVDSLSKGQ